MRAMRCVLVLAMLIALTGCQYFDWRASGRNLLQALCTNAEPCSVSCTENVPPGSGC